MGKNDGLDPKVLDKAVDDFMKKNKDRIADWKQMAKMEARIEKLEQRLAAALRQVEENTKARLAEERKRYEKAMEAQHQSILKMFRDNAARSGN